MNDHNKTPGDKIPPMLAVYAVHNLIARTVKAVIIIAAIWTALKPGGSPAAAVIMVLLAGAIQARSYGQDRERGG